MNKQKHRTNVVVQEIQRIPPLKDVMPTLHPRINSEDQKWNARLFKTMKLQHMSLLHSPSSPAL